MKARISIVNLDFAVSVYFESANFYCFPNLGPIAEIPETLLDLAIFRLIVLVLDISTFATVKF